MKTTVLLKPGDRTLDVQASETILDAALRQGLNLPHSCKGGSCRLCLARVLDGEVDHPGGPPAGVSAEEIAAGWVLTCRARPKRDAVISIPQVFDAAAAPIKRLPCRVQGVKPLCADVIALYLKLPAVERLEYHAGQYIDVILPGERRRSFSLANPPHDSSLLEIHVRRVPGGEFTTRVFQGLEQGALLQVEGPLGHFALRASEGRPLLMVAGGTGFAPLKAMLREVFECGPARSVTLYWGAQRERNLYSQNLISGWLESHGDFRYVPVLSESSADDGWRGRRGLVHTAVLEDRPNLSGCDVYASGPPAMIEAARTEFSAAGLPPERFHFDSFDYAPDSQTGATDT